jgi:hypothetical protein
MADEEALTPDETACCHLSAWWLDGQPLQQWRREFWDLAPSERCRDCPMVAAERARN